MLERPDTAWRIYRSSAVGDNLGGGIGAMRLQGSRIRGVVVDNPSGKWVKLDGIGLGFQPYIAPYTLAWSVSLLPSVAEVSATYVTGPAGQNGSALGSPIVVYLFEAGVTSSGGSTFVNPQDPSSFGHGSTGIFGSTFLAKVTGAAFLAGGLGALTQTFLANNLVLSAVCRTAAGEGKVSLILFDVTQGLSAGLATLLVQAGSPALLFIAGPYDLAGLAINNGMNLGDVIRFNLQVTDIVGANTYDVALSGAFSAY